MQIGNPHPDHKPRWGLAALLFALVFAVFWPVAHHYFVTFDDGIHIYQNPRFLDWNWKNFSLFWLHPYKGLYIPVTYSVWGFVSWLGEFHGHGVRFDPFLFHAVNLVLHSMNAVLVFWILEEMGAQWPACLVGALLFSLHPVQVEAVAWISGLKDVLAAFFSLFSILFFLSGDRNRRWLTMTLAFLFFILAMLSKPTAIMLPPIIALLCLIRGTGGKTVFRRLGLGMGIGIGLPILLLTKMQQPDAIIEFVTPFSKRWMVALDTWVFQIKNVLLPWRLTVNYGRTPDWVLRTGAWQVSLAAAVLLLGIVWRRRSERRLAFLCLAIFSLWLLPTLGFVPFFYQKYSTAADRFGYVAMLGAAILASFLFERGSRAVRIGFVFLLTGMVLLSRAQMGIWSTDSTLVTRITEVNPTAVNHYTLAGMLSDEFSGKNPLPGTAIRPYYRVRSAAEAKEWDRLIEFHYLEAIRLDPHFAKAYTNLGIYFQNHADPVKAEYYYRRALVEDPSMAEPHNDLGALLASEGKLDRALLEFEEAIRFDPGLSGAWFNKGLASESLGRQKAARDAYLAAAHLGPGNALVWKSLGRVSNQLEEWGAARYYLEKARNLESVAQKSSQETGGEARN